MRNSGKAFIRAASREWKRRTGTPRNMGQKRQGKSLLDMLLLGEIRIKRVQNKEHFNVASGKDCKLEVTGVWVKAALRKHRIGWSEVFS